MSKQFITIQIHTYYTVIKWGLHKIPPKENAFQNVTKARKLISLDQFSFSWVPFWKAFPFSVQQSRTGIFSHGHFLLTFFLAHCPPDNFVLFIILGTLSFGHFVLMKLCLLELLCAEYFVLWTFCPLDTLSFLYFVLMKLCPLHTLAFGYFVLWTFSPFDILFSGHFVF